MAIRDGGQGKINGGIGLTRGMKISKAVISNAFINYVISGYEYKKYINECSDLRQFQIISKTGHTYNETVGILPDGTEIPVQKVNRSFAVKDPNLDVKIFKVKRNIDLDTLELDDDWLNDEEVDELEKENEAEIRGNDSYTLAIQRAPKYSAISNEQVGNGIQLSQIDRDYYINEVSYLLKQWFGENWKKRIEQSHEQYLAQGFEFPKVKDYFG